MNSIQQLPQPQPKVKRLQDAKLVENMVSRMQSYSTHDKQQKYFIQFIIFLCCFFYVLFGVLSFFNFWIMKKMMTADQSKHLLTTQELKVVKVNYYLNIVNLALNGLSFLILLVLFINKEMKLNVLFNIILSITMFLNFGVPFLFEILIYGKQVQHKSKQLVKQWEAGFIKFYNIVIGICFLMFILILFNSILQTIFSWRIKHKE